MRYALFALGLRPTFRSASAWVLALPLALASAVPFGSWVGARAEGFVTDMYEIDDQGEIRVSLLREAATRGLESGMQGLGPGAHRVKAPYKRHFPPNFEAHNTLLDFSTQGGLRAVLSFLWLAATILSTTCQAGLAALTALLCGLLIFSTFHLIVRHPIFRFAVGLCLATGTPAQAGAGTGAPAIPGGR